MSTRIEAVVQRDERGALGLDVNGENMVMGCRPTANLRVGDIIIAVDGELLNGRHCKELLPIDQDSFRLALDRAEDADQRNRPSLNNLCKSFSNRGWER